MAGPLERTNIHDGAGAGASPIQWVLRVPPRQFTRASFVVRLYQHVLVYAALLIAAVYGCLFFFAPAETSLFSVAVIVLAGIVGALWSPSRRRLHRLLQGGIAVTYIAGAAALLKAFEAFFHRM
jgi:hypothetical protein